MSVSVSVIGGTTRRNKVLKWKMEFQEFWRMLYHLFFDNSKNKLDSSDIVARKNEERSRLSSKMLIKIFNFRGNTFHLFNNFTIQSENCYCTYIETTITNYFENSPNRDGHKNEVFSSSVFVYIISVMTMRIYSAIFITRMNEMSNQKVVIYRTKKDNFRKI